MELISDGIKTGKGNMENENITVEETVVDNDVNVGEEIVEDTTTEVEETSNNEGIELTDASNETSDAGSNNEPPRTYTEEEYQKAIDRIIARERRNYEKKINPLINTLKAGGYDSSDPVELESKVRQSFEANGIQLPKITESLSEREQKALAKADADEIIELGESAMKERFIELYSKPNRTIRESEEMHLIGKENSSRIAKRDLLELGAEPDKVLNDSKFQEFASKMASNIPIKEIYQLFQKVNGTTKEKPTNIGSLKSNHIESKENSNHEFQEWRKDAGL